MAAGTAYWGAVLMLAGCRQGPLPSTPEVKRTADTAEGVDEARWAAEADLGKQAEILLRGDLALNGREQVFVADRLRLPKSLAGGGREPTASLVFITRAAVLEKDGRKWSEMLRFDEHIKNPSGYLGGIPADSVAGWKIEYSLDAEHGLELKCSPAAVYITGEMQPGEHAQAKNANFDVRWNKKAKRYQAYDQSHERYLSEVPSLETPQSILK